MMAMLRGELLKAVSTRTIAGFTLTGVALTILNVDHAASDRLHLPFVAAYRVADAWDALGDPTRRMIVERLAERPRAVRDLADELPVSRPAVSQHLKVLKAAGLVTDSPAGTRRIYRLNPAGVGALRDQLDTFWNRALAGYKDAVEQPREERT